MNRIENRLKGKKSFISYITAGHPTVEISEEVIYKMVEAGTDLIEIGIPFSDPNAEGEVIHNANVKALENGMKIEMAFDLVKRVREKIDIPIVFLSYANPVFKYGYDKFFKKCKEVGADGVIIPDMPYEEQGEIKEFADENNIAIITLISPASENRIEMLAKEAKGFVYLVSSTGVTGIRNKFDNGLKGMYEMVRKYTDKPIAIGFGIGTPEHAKEISEISDGVIIGTAIVKIIDKYGKDSPDRVYEFVKSITQAIR